MKPRFARVCFMLLWIAAACGANDSGIIPQDVPLFLHDSNPLIKMKSFTVITSLAVEDAAMMLRLERSVGKALAAAGEVFRLQDNDMRGFATGNVILIQMQPVKGWNGEQMPLFRLSLSVETSVVLDKTRVRTFPVVWSVNTFIKGPVDGLFESNATQAAQRLISDFAQSYRYANQGQTLKPTLYIYD